MVNDYKKLREALGRIDRGERWERDFDPVGQIDTETGQAVAQVQSRAARDNDHRNLIADFIAAANPLTIAALLAELEAWRTRFPGYRYKDGDIAIQEVEQS